MISVAAGGLLGACGAEQEAMTAAAFREHANEICTAGGAEVHEAFFAVFGADDVTPGQMQEALDTVMSVSRRQLDDIDGLAEPSELRDEIDTFVAQGRADTDAAEAMGLGFLESETDPWARTSELAVELGLDACAGS